LVSISDFSSSSQFRLNKPQLLQINETRGLIVFCIGDAIKPDGVHWFQCAAHRLDHKRLSKKQVLNLTRLIQVQSQMNLLETCHRIVLSVTMSNIIKGFNGITFLDGSDLNQSNSEDTPRQGLVRIDI